MLPLSELLEPEDEEEVELEEYFAEVFGGGAVPGSGVGLLDRRGLISWSWVEYRSCC